MSRPRYVGGSAVAVRVFALRGAGLSYAQIATVLELDGIAPPGGEESSRWHASAVRRIYGIELARRIRKSK